MTQNNQILEPSVTPLPSPSATLGPDGDSLKTSPANDIIVFWPIYIPFIRQDPSPTPTSTPTPTATPSPTPTPTRTPRPPREFLVCSAPGSAIPDGTTSGLRADINLSDEGVLLDLDVYVRISHTYVGDLAIELVQRNISPLQSSVLLNRPGLANSAPIALANTSAGCALDNVQAIFDNNAEQYAENKCQANSMINVAVGGTFKAQNGLDQFRSQPAAGTWSLLVSDNASGNTGKLDSWCLYGWIGDVAVPLPTPTPPNLPAEAIISGLTGKAQALPLDCETRSAVDWAKYFGVTIDEMAFFNALPESDNPDEGFVGNVYGSWGQIPPKDYGVHAWPIANGLRSFGLTANGNRGLTFDDLRAEIAKGHPVIVWITGHLEPSAPQYYQAPSNQGISIVARYEHTVVVYGYSASYVYVLDGADKYAVNIDRFLDSWSALGNMAVMATP